MSIFTNFFKGKDSSGLHSGVKITLTARKGADHPDIELMNSAHPAPTHPMSWEEFSGDPKNESYLPVIDKALDSYRKEISGKGPRTETKPPQDEKLAEGRSSAPGTEPDKALELHRDLRNSPEKDTATSDVSYAHVKVGGDYKQVVQIDKEHALVLINRDGHEKVSLIGKGVTQEAASRLGEGGDLREKTLQAVNERLAHAKGAEGQDLRLMLDTVRQLGAPPPARDGARPPMRGDAYAAAPPVGEGQAQAAQALGMAAEFFMGMFAPRGHGFYGHHFHENAFPPREPREQAGRIVEEKRLPNRGPRDFFDHKV